MAKRRGKKLKDKGKKIISLPDANTEVVPPALVSQSVPLQPHALLGKRKANNISKSLHGFIFMCNERTKPECYRYHVFGLPAGRREEVEKVKKGMKLFLFDFDVKLLYGVYEATSDGQMNVESSAFGGKFPAQVSFAIYKECLPLREAAFKVAIKDNYVGSKFKAELTALQVKDLLSLFCPCASLTAASVAPIPQAVVPSQAIWPPVAGTHRFQSSAILPSSQDPYLAGTQHRFQSSAILPSSQDPYLAGTQHRFQSSAILPSSQDPYLAGTQHLFQSSAILPSSQDPYLAGTRHQFQSSAILPSSQDPHLAGAQHSYAAPITEPRFPQQRLLNGPYYYAESQRPHLAEDTSKIPMDPYPRYAALQQMVPRDQFANTAAGYNTYPTTATSLHPPHEEREYNMQPQNVLGHYPTYPIPATTPQGLPPHHLHGGKGYELHRENVAGHYKPYPVLAASQGPTGRFPGSSNY